MKHNKRIAILTTCLVSVAAFLPFRSGLGQDVAEVGKAPTPEQIETVKKGMHLELLEPARNMGSATPFSLRFDLPPNAVSLLEFTSN